MNVFLFYLFVNLINLSETPLTYICGSHSVYFLSILLHLFVDHNLFMWNNVTKLSSYEFAFKNLLITCKTMLYNVVKMYKVNYMLFCL